MIRSDDLAWFDERDAPRKSRIRQDDSSQIKKAMCGRLANSKYQTSLKSSKPQAVLKVASFAKGVRARTLMEYVTRIGQKDEKGNSAELEFRDQDGFRLNGSEDVNDLYGEWSQDFDRKKRGGKREPRHVTHIILSAPTDNSENSTMKVDFAARDFLDEYFRELGYEYLYVTHRDTKNPHVHIVVKNYNRRTKRKLHLSKETTFHMRSKWSEALDNRGVEAVATLRRDRLDVLEKVEKGIEEIRTKETWNDRIMLRSSSLVGSDRTFLINRLDGLTKKVDRSELIDPGKKEAAGDRLKDLRSTLQGGTKKDIGRMLGTIQNSIGQEVPEIREELSSWVEGSHVPDMTYRQRKAMASKIVRMKEDVKASTTILTPQRREYMKALRALDTAVRSKSRREVSRSAEAVLKRAGRDIQSIQKHLSGSFISGTTGDRGRANAKATEHGLRAAYAQSEILMREIREAANIVSSSSMSGDTRKQIVSGLRDQLNSAKRLQAAVRNPRMLQKVLDSKSKSKRIRTLTKEKEQENER